MSAADKQAEAAEEAGRVSQRQFNQTRDDLTPYRQVGTLALSELHGRLPELTKPFGMEDFQQSPNYQFNLEQGQKALDKAAAKRGTYYAPSTMQDLSRYSQGIASNEFQNSFNNYQTNMGNIWQRLYGLSGMGQSAANQTGAFGAAASGQQGAMITDGGAARAAGTVGMANAATGAYGDYRNQQTLDAVLARNQAPSRSQPNAMRGMFDYGLGE